MYILESTSSWAGFRQLVASQPLLIQVLEIMLLTDFVQYWFHRQFHEIPFYGAFTPCTTRRKNGLASGLAHAHMRKSSACGASPLFLCLYWAIANRR